jgi:phospholipase/carboxylesterase
MQPNKCSTSNLEFLTREGNSKKGILMLHGYGASQSDLFPLADYVDAKGEFTWFFPNAPLEIGNMFMSMRAWFPLDMQQLEISQQSRNWDAFAQYCPDEFIASLNQLVQFIAEQFKGFDEIHLGGFSQGSMMAYHLLLDHPHLDAKTLTLFSTALVAQHKLEDHTDSFRIFQSHGKQDQVLDFSAGELMQQKLTKTFSDHTWKPFDGGHEIPPQVLSDWWNWLN